MPFGNCCCIPLCLPLKQRNLRRIMVIVYLSYAATAVVYCQEQNPKG